MCVPDTPKTLTVLATLTLYLEGLYGTETDLWCENTHDGGYSNKTKNQLTAT